MLNKKRLMAACAGALVTCGVAGQADAGLMIDLRLADGSKLVQIHNGDVLDINIYAVLSGQQTGRKTHKTTGFPIKNVVDWDYSEGMVLAQGSVKVKNQQGAIVGNGNSAVYPNGYVAPNGTILVGVQKLSGLGSSPGEIADLDGDGVLDLGAPNGSIAPDVAWKFVGLRGDPSAPLLTGNPDAATAEVLIGTIGIYIDAIGPRGVAEVNWDPQRGINGNILASAALWAEDYLRPRVPDPTNLGGVLAPGKDPLSGQFSVGDPILLVVPEPTSLSLLGLGAAAFLGRRNRRQA